MAQQFIRDLELVLPGRRLVRGLRVAFHVKRRLAKEPDTAEVRVWNLSEEHRASLSDRAESGGQAPAVLLNAGYRGSLGRLFLGDVVLVSHMRDGPDWLTKVDLADGVRDHRDVRVSLSVSPGATAAQVLRSMSGKMAASVSRAAARAASGDLQGARNEFVSGLALEGTASDVLDEIMRSMGVDWTIQDGEVVALNPGEPEVGEVTLLTRETGLLGTPELGTREEGAKGSTPAKRRRAVFWKASSLLNPRVQPGRAVEIRSEAVSGVFRVEATDHSGDTHGDDWRTGIEAVPVRG